MTAGNFTKLALAILISFAPYAHAVDFEHTASGDGKAKCDPANPPGTYGNVVRVVDGDTAHIKIDNKDYSVRFLGIDTPEKNFQGKSQGEWANRATDKLNELLKVGVGVRLEYTDTSPCDAHGRVLAHIFNGPVHVNKEMVAAGLAVNYCVYPSETYCEEIGVLAQKNLDNHTGMFSDPTVEVPYDFRRRVGGNPQRSSVGHIITKEVHSPGNQDKTPLGARIFFYPGVTIKAPYHLVD